VNSVAAVAKSFASNAAFRAGYFLLNHVRQYPLAHVAECGANTGRHVGRRAVRRIPDDDRLDRALGFTGPAESQQAQRAILLDHPLLVRPAGVGQLAEHGQRVFIRRRRIQLAGRRERILSHREHRHDE
jgi:hypothetical protein